MAKTIICIPALNEADNLELLLPEIGECAISLGMEALEVLVFDDGSTDGTYDRFAAADVRGIKLTMLRSRRNIGKAHALGELFTRALAANPDHVIMLDADGQDDPIYIRDIIEKLTAGADVVSGRRVNRAHPFGKRLSSKLFNFVARIVTGLPVLDLNSGLKGFSNLGASALRPYLYGELHRVVLIIAMWLGLETDEVRVVNRPRAHGKSKYGFARGWRGLADLLTIQFLVKHHSSPSHFFSGVGLGFLLFGMLGLILGSSLAGPISRSVFLDYLPLGGLGMMFLGLTLVGLGLVAEMLVLLNRAPVLSVVQTSAEVRVAERAPE